MNIIKVLVYNVTMSFQIAFREANTVHDFFSTSPRQDFGSYCNLPFRINSGRYSLVFLLRKRANMQHFAESS